MSQRIDSPSTPNIQCLPVQCLPVVFSPQAKRFFKGVNLEKLEKIFNHSLVYELDSLFVSGELSDDDLKTYCMLLPEWRELIRKMYGVVDDILAFASPQITSMVKQTFRSDGSYYPANLVQIYDESANLCSAFVRENQYMFWGGLLMRFANVMLGLLTIKIKEEIEKLPHFRDSFTLNYGSRFFDTATERIGSRFSGGFNFFHLVKTVSCVEDNHDTYEADLLNFLDTYVGKQQSPSKLQESANQKFNFISELGAVYDMGIVEKQFQGVVVQIVDISNKVPPRLRGDFLYKVRLIFDKEKYVNKENLFTAEDAEDMRLRFSKGFYELMIEGLSGDLVTFPNYPLSKLIDGQHYAKLKNVIYDLILDTLAQRELEDNLEEEDQGEEIVSIHQNTYERVQRTFVPETEKGRNYNEVAQRETRKNEKNHVKLTNRTGSLVLQAFIKILGDPIRNEGSSHFVFRGRNGVVYPLSIHHGEDVGKGLLLKCLKMLGISRREFEAAYRS